MRARNQIFKDVVCPFCSLLCDDLAVESRAKGLHIREPRCRLAVRGFEFEETLLLPSVNGRTCSMEDAIGAAARVLKNATQPLISGMDTDADGCRAALALAERTGAVIAPASDAANHNFRVLQRGGWIMTTLTEVRNRADFLLFVGTDAAGGYPRFFERFVWNRTALRRGRHSNLSVNYLGHALNTRPGASPDGSRPASISCAPEQLGAMTVALRTLINGFEIEPGVIPTARARALKALAERARAARYAVVVWSPGDLPAREAPVVIQSICDIVRTLNRTTRAAGLSLGGAHGAATFANVCAWQTGYPASVSFATGGAEYDPDRYSAHSMLGAGAADALLWIAATDPEPVLPEAGIPLILLGRALPAGMERKGIHIPVGVPGLDHAGTQFRTDSVVSLRLRALRTARARSVSEVLNRIREAL